MRWINFFYLALLASFILLLANLSLAEEVKDKDFFQSIDKNKDNLICREEWEALDKDKDNVICKEEWEKWEYKTKPGKESTWFDLKWYDNNGDGFMDQEEFYRYPRGSH